MWADNGVGECLIGSRNGSALRHRPARGGRRVSGVHVV